MNYKPSDAKNLEMLRSAADQLEATASELTLAVSRLTLAVSRLTSQPKKKKKPTITSSND